MRGQKRPTSDRIRALGIAVVDGPEAASRETGVPRTTIIGWMGTPEYDELRQRTKEAVTEEWWAIVQRGFRRVGELLESTPDLQKVAVATAIVADKMLLVRGDATSRSESRDLTANFDDHELDLLGDAIRGELGRRTNSDPAETAVEPALPTGAATPTG